MRYLGFGSLTREALSSLRAHYGPVIDQAAQQFGIPYGEWYGWLMAARIFEPDPVSVARLRVRSVYTSPARLAAYLAKGAELGLLAPVGEGEYRLNAAGHAAVQRLIDAAYGAMVPLAPLPAEELSRLADLLWKLVSGCLAAPEPPGKWCLSTARHYDPGTSAPALVRIDQYLSDLDAYWDDAYLAAWQPCGVSGQAWEALTLLWREEASSAAEICARLERRRGYSRDDYVEALQELAARGWVAGDGARATLTDQGRAVRDEVEATTERLFYAAWACLDDVELGQLRGLLANVREGLERLRA